MVMTRLHSTRLHLTRRSFGMVALEAMARTAGYRWTGRVESTEALDEALPGFLTRSGPAFLLVRIALGPPGAPGPRIPWTPAEMTARLRRALGSE